MLNKAHHGLVRGSGDLALRVSFANIRKRAVNWSLYASGRNPGYRSVMAQSRYYYGICLKRLSKTMNHISQDVRISQKSSEAAFKPIRVKTVVGTPAGSVSFSGLVSFVLLERGVHTIR